MLTRSSPAVALVGAGTQGRRLAFMWSKRGKPVHLVDSRPSQLDESLETIRALRSGVKSPQEWGKVTMHGPTALKEVLRDSWLVIECVPERLTLKKQVIQNLDSLAPDDTIVASNSSSYSCTELLEGLDLRRRERILSAHTYWPPETPEIEIMGHETTDRACLDMVIEQCARHGFVPFEVKTPSMGYIYNRIWAAIKREALLTAAEGAASPEEIDRIFKGILKTPKGPFEQMDVVGLDVVLDIEEHYAAARRGIPEAPRTYLKHMIEQNRLGVKSGQGFYSYQSESVPQDQQSGSPSL